MTRFRAILEDPGNTTRERPVQIFGNSREEIDRWAEVVLATAISDDAVVKIFETVESQIGRVKKPQKQQKVSHA